MLSHRLGLYRRLEKKRGRPLIAYVTSTRHGSEGNISGDAVGEMQLQLQALPRGTKDLDLLLVSVGGDPTVAWRMVSLIRERCERFSVLVPHAAYSAATLIVLGADEIIMHPNGNLGPTDPQVVARKPGAKEQVSFGSEDLSAFLNFVKDNVSAKNENLLATAFQKFCDDAGSAIAIGVAARGAQLSLKMGEKLLQLHMTGDAKGKAKGIAEKLTKDFLHHGYPVNRSEASEIGLKVAKADPEIESIMWSIWASLTEDLRLREPFAAVGLLKDTPACAPLFAPVPTFNLPANLPPDVMQQVVGQILAQVAVANVPAVPFELCHAVMESPRIATRCVTRGSILATRLPDLTLRMSNVIERQGWVTVHPKAAATQIIVPVVTQPTAQPFQPEPNFPPGPADAPTPAEATADLPNDDQKGQIADLITPTANTNP